MNEEKAHQLLKIKKKVNISMVFMPMASAFESIRQKD